MSERAATPSILLVDDDHLVLSSLRSLFRLETDYNFIESSDPLDALSTPVDTDNDFICDTDCQLDSRAFVRFGN